MSKSTQAEAPIEEKLLLKRAGAVAHIVFNNPARLNATSLEMWQRLVHLLDELKSDPDLRVLVVSGAGGRAFVSGADVSKFESERSSKEGVAIYNAASAAAYEALYNFPRPTVAAIQGYCIGGGVNVAVCCDLRVATEGSKFGIPAGRLGLGYGFPGVNRLSEIIGISRAMELFYTAKQIGSEEALGIGLINKVVPNDGLEAAVAELTSTISDNAPMTIATIKAVAREIGKPSAQRDLDKLDRMVIACFESEDYTEGRRAFMEKRKPVFKGR